MKVNYNKVLKNKILISIDKIFRFFGYCIVLVVNTNTNFLESFHIDKKWN
jgi:hypothetical protein